MSAKEFLSRAEAAAHLSQRGLTVAKTTLQKMATIGGGPAYRRFGNRAVYKPGDLDQWAADKLRPSKHSTSEQK